MASLKELIQNYISEATNSPDKTRAAREVASKLKGLSYTGSNANIPKADLLSTLRIVKGSANDSHVELIDAVIATLEKNETE